MFADLPRESRRLIRKVSRRLQGLMELTDWTVFAPFGDQANPVGIWLYCPSRRFLATLQVPRSKIQQLIVVCDGPRGRFAVGPLGERLRNIGTSSPSKSSARETCLKDEYLHGGSRPLENDVHNSNDLGSYLRRLLLSTTHLTPLLIQ